MIRDNKLTHYIDRILYSQKPITADIFLTDFCNNKCVYCRYAHTRSGKYITFEQFKKYGEALLKLGVKGFILTGGGEPMINPDFEKITTWLEEQGIDYGINTNINTLHYCKPNFLKVSLDTGDRETYKKIRGVDTLNNVLQNLQLFIDWKLLNSPQTKIGLQCMTTKVEQVLDFYEAIKDFQVDYIQFRPFETQGDNLEYKDIVYEIENIKDPRIIKSYKYDLIGFKPQSCIGNWSVITIDVDGNVPYCCHKPDSIVGHILDKDILNKKRLYQNDMKTCETPCRLSGANKYLSEFKIENDIHFL